MVELFALLLVAGSCLLAAGLWTRARETSEQVLWREDWTDRDYVAIATTAVAVRQFRKTGELSQANLDRLLTMLSTLKRDHKWGARRLRDGMATHVSDAELVEWITRGSRRHRAKAAAFLVTLDGDALVTDALRACKHQPRM